MSGSTRYLIMSASAAFWNAPSFNSNVLSAVVRFRIKVLPALRATGSNSSNLSNQSQWSEEEGFVLDTPAQSKLFL